MFAILYLVRFLHICFYISWKSYLSFLWYFLWQCNYFQYLTVPIGIGVYFQTLENDQAVGIQTFYNVSAVLLVLNYEVKEFQNRCLILFSKTFFGRNQHLIENYSVSCEPMINVQLTVISLLCLTMPLLSNI